MSMAAKLRPTILFLICLAITTAPAMGSESFWTNPLAALLWQKDASKFAGKMAATIRNRPDCTRFKDEILRQGKGSPYEAKTMYAINKAKADARAFGCTTD